MQEYYAIDQAWNQVKWKAIKSSADFNAIISVSSFILLIVFTALVIFLLFKFKIFFRNGKTSKEEEANELNSSLKKQAMSLFLWIYMKEWYCQAGFSRHECGLRLKKYSHELSFKEKCFGNKYNDITILELLRNQQRARFISLRTNMEWYECRRWQIALDCFTSA